MKKDIALLVLGGLSLIVGGIFHTFIVSPVTPRKTLGVLLFEPACDFVGFCKPAIRFVDLGMNTGGIVYLSALGLKPIEYRNMVDEVYPSDWKEKQIEAIMSGDDAYIEFAAELNVYRTRLANKLVHVRGPELATWIIRNGALLPTEKVSGTDRMFNSPWLAGSLV